MQFEAGDRNEREAGRVGICVDRSRPGTPQKGGPSRRKHSAHVGGLCSVSDRNRAPGARAVVGGEGRAGPVEGDGH